MKKYAYLLIAILGIVLPYTQFVSWSNENGFDLDSMVSLMFANQIASGIALDALVAGLAILLFILIDRKESKVKYWWVSILGIFLSGIAFALPFYLYLRELSLEKRRR